MPASKTRLPRALRQLIGRECWKAAFTYGGELSLHFGARLPYDTAKMAGRKRGEWILGTRGTRWILVTPTQSLSSDSETEEQLDRKVKALKRGKVVSFEQVSSRDWVMTFSNGCFFHIAPSADDQEAGLPYWELFTPNDTVITFGPGDALSSERSDVPMSN